MEKTHQHIYMQRSQIITDSYCTLCGQQKPQELIEFERLKPLEAKEKT